MRKLAKYSEIYQKDKYNQILTLCTPHIMLYRIIELCKGNKKFLKHDAGTLDLFSRKVAQSAIEGVVLIITKKVVNKH